MASKSRLSSGGYGTRRTGSFASKAVDLGVVEDAFLSALVAATSGIKKPGIPTGTEAWLKTMLEIMLGRRGNSIAIPAPRTLTFSAVPTKEECEALYALVNEVRDTQAKIITRFDS